MVRLIFRLALVVSVLLTGYGAAYARGANPAVDQMVICAGHVTDVIYVDAEGKETIAPHLCPDCITHLLGDFAAPVQCGHASVLVRASVGITTAASVTKVAVFGHRARAPPVLI